MGLGDIFDVVGTMVDIVKGGIDSYKTGEKLDELIEKSINEYEDLLSDDGAASSAWGSSSSSSSSPASSSSSMSSSSEFPLIFSSASIG